MFCGSISWNHPSLLSSFYPEDLPDDWRLPYYANEFNAVLVPEQEWLFAGEDEYTQWGEDTGESFRFFFQESNKHEQKQLAFIKKALGEKFGGLVKLQHADSKIQVLEHSLDDTKPKIVVALIGNPLLDDLKLLRKNFDELGQRYASVESVYLFAEAPSSLYKSLKSVQMLLELSGY